MKIEALIQIEMLTNTPVPADGEEYGINVFYVIDVDGCELVVVMYNNSTGGGQFGCNEAATEYWL